MKKFAILVGKHGRPSTKEIFKNLTGTNVNHVIKSSVFNGFVHRNNPANMNQKTKLRNLQSYDCKNSIVLRWGWYGSIETDSSTIVYNSAEAIKAANNKGESRKLLASKGIDVPKTYFREDLNQMSSVPFPLIARPSHHGRGRALYVCNNARELNQAISRGAAYFSEIYPKTEEYRVHCFLGKIVEVMRKPTPADPNQIAWNRAQNDAPFTRVQWDDWENFICKLALRATKAAGLDIAKHNWR